MTFADTLPVLPVHDAHLVHLFQNLIGNALTYRSAEDPRIHVDCNRTDDGCIVQVSDNGIGIDLKCRELIFKPFKRTSWWGPPGQWYGSGDLPENHRQLKRQDLGRLDAEKGLPVHFYYPFAQSIRRYHPHLGSRGQHRIILFSQ